MTKKEIKKILKEKKNFFDKAYDEHGVNNDYISTKNLIVYIKTKDKGQTFIANWISFSPFIKNKVMIGINNKGESLLNKFFKLKDIELIYIKQTDDHFNFLPIYILNYINSVEDCKINVVDGYNTINIQFDNMKEYTYEHVDANVTLHYDSMSINNYTVTFYYKLTKMHECSLVDYVVNNKLAGLIYYYG